MWSRRKPGKPRHADGFMLVEVLVTAAVAAVLLGTLMRAFASVWGGIGAVREDTEAMLVARAVIEASTPRINLVPLTQDGMAGRYAWAISVVSTGIQAIIATEQQGQQQGQQGQQQQLQQQQQQQFGRTPLQNAQQPGTGNQPDAGDQQGANQDQPWTLFRITVAVRAPSGRRTTLETVRLSRPPSPR
jgi:hypothetical protein